MTSNEAPLYVNGYRWRWNATRQLYEICLGNEILLTTHVMLEAASMVERLNTQANLLDRAFRSMRWCLMEFLFGQPEGPTVKDLREQMGCYHEIELFLGRPPMALEDPRGEG